MLIITCVATSIPCVAQTMTSLSTRKTFESSVFGQQPAQVLSQLMQTIEPVQNLITLCACGTSNFGVAYDDCEGTYVDEDGLARTGNTAAARHCARAATIEDKPVI